MRAAAVSLEQAQPFGRAQIWPQGWQESPQGQVPMHTMQQPVELSLQPSSAAHVAPATNARISSARRGPRAGMLHLAYAARMPRGCHTQLTVTVLVVTLFASVLPSSVARAHDAGDLPVSGSQDTHPRPPAPNSTAPSPARRSLRWPLVLLGAGVLVAAGGGWVAYEEHRAATAPCTAPLGFAQCPSPSSGGGAGVALLLVGGQLALGGVIWLAFSLSAHDRFTPVALGIGPGTLGLRATF